MPAGPRGEDISPMMRKNLKKAIIYMVRKTGKPFHEIIGDWMMESPKAALEVISAFKQYQPRERHVSTTVHGSVAHTHTHRLDTPDAVSAADAILGQFVRTGEGADLEAPVQDQPVLPHPVRVQSG